MNNPLTLLWTQTWQIAALAMIVAVVVKLAARDRPHLAHALWILVLIKCVTPPLWGHSLGVFSRMQTLIEHVSDAPTTDADSIAAFSVLPAEVTQLQEPVLVEDALVPLTEFPPPLDDIANVPERDAEQFDVATNQEWPVHQEFVSDDSTAQSANVGWATIMLWTVVFGAIATLLITIVRCACALRLIHRHRTTELDDALNDRLQQLATQLRIRRVPRIVVSDVLFGPAVLGLLRPAIVLPRCLFEPLTLDERSEVSRPINQRSPAWNKQTPEDSRPAARRGVTIEGKEDLHFLDPVLAHELLHIRRGDLSIGTLQVIAQSLWWFHPAVWFLNRWLSREAERCCDEQVIAELGCSPGQYARSLLAVIESKHTLQPIPVFPGMKPVEITTQRMERIMSLKTGLNKRTPLWCWLSVVALAIVVLPGAVAQPTPDESEPNQATEDSESANEPKRRITLRSFKGNAFWTNESLRMKLVGEKSYWNLLSEDFSPDTISADTKALTDYYRNEGFFDVDVTGKALFSRDRSEVCLAYTITEGVRYKVREVRFEGNKQIATADLEEQLTLKPGDEWNSIAVAADIKKIRSHYAGLTRTVSVNPVPHFLEQAGVFDLVFEIDEGITARIRLSDDFIPYSDMELKGKSVIAFVDEKPIAVDEIINAWLITQMEQDKNFSIEQRRALLMQWLTERLPNYLYEEVVLVHFAENVTGSRKVRIEESLNPEFAEMLQKMRISHGAADTEALEKLLLPQGLSIAQLRKSFNRSQIVVGYLKTLPEESPLRAKDVILEHCRQLIRSASQVTKVSASALEIEIAEEPLPGNRQDRVQSIYDASELITRMAKERSVDRMTAGESVRAVIEQWLNSATDSRAAPIFPWKVTLDEERLVNISPSKQSRHFIETVSLFEKHGFESFLVEVQAFELPNQVAESILDAATVVSPVEATPAPPSDTEAALATAPKPIANLPNRIEADRRIRATVMSDAQMESLRQKASAGSVPVLADESIAILNGQVGQFRQLGATEFLADVGLDVRVKRLDESLISLKCALQNSVKERFEGEKVSVQSAVELTSAQWLVFQALRKKTGDDQFQAVLMAVRVQRFDPSAIAATPVGVPRQDTGIRHAISEIAGSKRMIQVQGAVRNPGTYVLTDDSECRILDAIALAGGFTEDAAKTINIKRRSALIQINCDEAKRNSGANMLIGAGDTVVVTRAQDDAAEAKPNANGVPQFVLATYPVADLIIPVPQISNAVATRSGMKNSDQERAVTENQSVRLESSRATPAEVAKLAAQVSKADFAPFVELIKASVEPESWGNRGEIAEDIQTISLVIRQTVKAHEEIAELIMKLRNGQDANVQITSLLVKLTNEEQLKLIEDRNTLHSLADGIKWALLTPKRSESLTKALLDQKPETISSPKIMTISGQAAMIMAGSMDKSVFSGMKLTVTPQLLSDSSIIRLQHAVTICPDRRTDETSGATINTDNFVLLGGQDLSNPGSVFHESLVGSGQTLLLLIEQPRPDDAAKGVDRYVLMLTPEHVVEEKETLDGGK